jgi:ribulose-phosphate 3-epimerase
MIDNPSINMCERISEYKNVKLVYFHSEVLQENKIEEFNDFSFDLALALKPDIDLSKEINKLLKVSDILIMTVHPGYNGAPFVPEALNKIDELKNKGFEGTFHIDGSVNKNTIEEILKFDPTVLNVGSAISGSENPEKAYLELTSFLN